MLKITDLTASKELTSHEMSGVTGGTSELESFSALLDFSTSLLNKVADGKASKEEKDKLLDLYISLVDNKPSKGETGAWIMAAGRLTVAAARVSVGREGAEAELKTASNCKACHQVFK